MSVIGYWVAACGEIERYTDRIEACHCEKQAKQLQQELEQLHGHRQRLEAQLQQPSHSKAPVFFGVS